VSGASGGRTLTVLLSALVAALGVAVVIGVAGLGWALIR